MAGERLRLNAGLYFQSALLLTRITLRFWLKKTILMLIAALALLVMMVFLTAAIFLSVKLAVGPIWASVAVAAGYLGLALIALLWARFSGPGTEFAAAEETQNLAAENFEAELRATPILRMVSGLSGSAARARPLYLMAFLLLSFLRAALRKPTQRNTKSTVD